MSLQSKTSSLYDFDERMKSWKRFTSLVNEGEPDVGSTPRTAIWKKNKASLWHYTPKEKKYEVPILIIYSLFNRSYILDLAPGMSTIEALIDKGYDVYLLDWGIPREEDSHLTFDHYIYDYIEKAVKRVLRHAEADEISLLGYCLGGTMAAMYTAIAKEPIKNLMVAATPVDFSEGALPSVWQEAVEKGDLCLDRYIDVHGNVPAKVVQAMFRMVSSPVYYSPYVNLFNRVLDDKYVYKWRRFNKWTDEHIPIAGETFRQLMNDFTKENKLVKGEMYLRGKRVDFANIHSNLLIVSSKNDHLVLEEQSLPLLELVSSKDKTIQYAKAGHVSLALTKEFPEMLDAWFKKRS